MRKLIGQISLLLLVLISSDAYAESEQRTPASIVELTMLSHGQRLPGLAYLAAGNGPHPTVILLHGYPGNEKNLDVAQALRRAGWNAVFFHYRGAWGAEGKFSFINAEQDVQSVIAYLQDETNAKRLRIDPKKISLVGHSMGGHMAIAGILDNPTIICSVAYDGANLGANNKGFLNDPETAKLWMSYTDSLFMLEGWSSEELKRQTQQYSDRLNLINRVDQLTARSVLLIAADTDVIPLDLHIKPLFNALSSRADATVEYLLIDDDHSFSNSRLELIEATNSFLDQHCRQTVKGNLN